MSDNRKYRDDEVAEIFDLAVSAPSSERPAVFDEDGLTLAQLQEVGREVGVEPARIAEAAQTLDSRRSALPRRTSLGMPISVGRVIELPRAVTDKEWDVLVSEFRQTFAAQGKLTSRDGARVWKNSKLRASLEATDSGHRLRIETTKGGAMAQNILGVGSLAAALIMIVMMVTTGGSPVAREMELLWAMAIGIAALVSNVVRLPSWAREREEQMEYLDGRVRSLIGAKPAGDPAE